MNDVKPASFRSNEPRKFARDIIWVGIAQIFNSLIVGVGTMPALTKYYPPDVYGIWTQIQVTYGLLSPIIAIQLSLAVVRFLAPEEDRAKRRQVLGAMLLAITVVSGIFLVIGNIFASHVSIILFNTPDYTVFARLTVLWIVVSAYFTFLISYMRARGKIRLLSVRQIIVALLTLGIVIVMATKGIQLEWVVVSVIGIWIVFTLFFFIMVIREVGWPLPNTISLKSYLVFSMPQLPGGILLWVIASSNRYFITHFLGLAQAGIYSSSDKLGGLISLFYFPIQFVVYPLLAKLWDRKQYGDVKKYLEYSTKLFLTLAIPSAIGIAILSQPLLHILTTSEFLIGSTLVFLIAIGTLFMGIYLINVNIVLLLKRTKLLPVVIGTAAIISLVLNILLIPHIGLIGAAIANIGSFFTLAAIVSVWARKQVGYGIDVIYLLKVTGASLVMSVCVYFIKAHNILTIILAITLGIIVYVACLLLLKSFSEQDKKLMKSIVGDLVPGWKKRSG